MPPSSPATDNDSIWVNVADLRVGMWVHLDLGWWQHPFPVSSFRLTSAEQIEKIRQLGLARVRCDPPEEAEETPGSGDTGATTPAVKAESPEVRARKARRAALMSQRQSNAMAQRQYAEARSVLREVQDMATREPPQALQRTQELCRAMVSKMLVNREMAVRLVTEGGGDIATAHALNVTVLSLLMGRVFGLSEEEMHDLGTGALLHDVGKLEIPHRVRILDDGFSQPEVNLYREHVAHGVAIGRKMGMGAGALMVLGQHHELADGSGFPQRLNVDRMTAPARIVAMINRYDNHCNPARPTSTLTPHEALSMMFAQGRNKFDTTLLNAFIRMVGVYPPGSAVQLTDDRYALVVSANTSRPLKPRVMVFDPKVPRDEALYVDLDKADGLGIRRSLKAALLPEPAREYLDTPQRVAYFFDAVASETEGWPDSQPNVAMAR